MMRARVAALWTAAIAAAGCSDPTLRVEVVVPEVFRDDPSEIVVRVYGDDQHACDQVEFGEVTIAELQAAFVDEAVIGSDDDTLSDVPREGAKLFVAEGFDPDGNRLFAGCEGRSEITGDALVTIEAHPVATTSILGDQLDRPFARRTIEVTAVDAKGNPLNARPMRWKSYGPVGAFPESEGVAESTNPICTERGVARVIPADPTIPGPIAAQIYVSWADVLPPVLSGFIAEQMPPTTALTGAGGARAPSCVVRQEAGDDQVYCLTRGTDRGVVRLILSGDTLGSTQATTTTTGDWLVVAPDANGDQNDDLYALEVDRTQNRVNWVGVAGTPSGGSVTVCADKDCLLGITRVVAAPACGETPGFVVIAAKVAGQQDRFLIATLTGEATGLVLDEPESAMVTLVAAGCIAESTTDGIAHPAFVTRVLDEAPIVSNKVRTLCPSGELCEARWPGIGAVGFSGGNRPRLLSSEIDLSGNVLVESELAVAQGVLKLVERGRTPTIAAVESLATGELDDDIYEDLAWTLTFAGSGTNAFSNRIQIALDRTKRDLPFSGRMTGVSPPRGADDPVQILVADLDHDGDDDVLTFSDVEVSLYRSGKFVEPAAPTGAETLCP